MNWIELLQNLGVFSLITGAITYLINSFFNKKVEAYKKELQTDLESHKSELNLYNSRDSKVYVKRVEVIEELYDKLCTLDKNMKILTAKIHPIIEDAEKEKYERAVNAQEALIKFIEYYTPKKIYLSKRNSDKIDKIIQTYREARSEFHTPDNLRAMGVKNLPFKEIKDSFDKANQKVYQESEEIKTQLESEFRKIYQIEDE